MKWKKGFVLAFHFWVFHGTTKLKDYFDDYHDDNDYDDDVGDDAYLRDGHSISMATNG